MGTQSLTVVHKRTRKNNKKRIDEIFIVFDIFPTIF